MVEAGNISIGGVINTQVIERGLTRIEKGLDSVVTSGKSVNADFVRMNQSASRLGRTFGVLAIAGSGALIGIAKGAPAVAGAMAQISLAALKLQFAVGTALKPQIDWFANRLGQLASWIQRHPDLFGMITTSVLALGAAFLAFKIGAGFMGLITLITSPYFLIAVGSVVALGSAIYSVYRWWKALNEVKTESIVEKVFTITTKGPLSYGPASFGLDDIIKELIKKIVREASRRNITIYNPDTY